MRKQKKKRKRSRKDARGDAKQKRVQKKIEEHETEPDKKDELRFSPTGRPRVHVLRVCVSEHYGPKHVPGSGRTFRVYPTDKVRAAQIVDEVVAELYRRLQIEEKEQAER